MRATRLRQDTSSRQAFERLGGLSAAVPPLHEDDVLARRRIGAPAPVVREAVRAIDDQGVVSGSLAPPALEGAVLHQAPEKRRFRWARNVFLGASLSFADAGLLALRPVNFVWQHAHTIAQAAIYLLLPALISVWLLDTFPVLAEFCKTQTALGVTYLLGLYASSAVLLMLGAFSAGFLWRGAVRLMDHFARRGDEAFPRR